MNRYDLSILIPARNEMFLAKTVENVLANIRGNTEIIIHLDGAWADPGIPDNDRVTIIYSPKPIGQRAGTNKACRLSKAKWVMKLDAHAAVDEGFDVKMMEAMEDDITMVPLMRNLHAFDWVCSDGHRRYQGPSGVCKECGKATTRDILWKAKESPKSTAFRFDKTLHFQYHNDRKKSADYQYGVIVGYKLSFDPRTVPSRIIGFLTDFASSHNFTCSRNNAWFRKNMSTDTVGFSSINDSRSVGGKQILCIGNKVEMERVTTPSVFTKMVDNWDVFTPSPWEIADNPSVEDTMCECFLPETMEASVSAFINATDPVPASGSIINSDMINKLNDILGGKFIYSEKSRSFHNGSVALTPIRNKYLNKTLSLQGSCFMLTREKYWELDICDEKHGSWGQQGTEVACKTWLSGGRVLCNQKTWYAHMFRTQGGDFGFPYPLSGREVDKAREYSKQLFIGNSWPKALHDLQWLLNKFFPVPDWHDGQAKKGIVFYTDNQLNLKIAHKVQKQLRGIGLPIVSASLKPMPKMGKNIHLPLQRGYLTMFKQILTALEASEVDIIYMCEHDVLYHPSHFTFIPAEKDKFYYNQNWWKVREDGYAVHWDADQVSGLVAYRDVLIDWYRKRIETFDTQNFDRKFEPMSGVGSVAWKSEFPNIDIRGSHNLTYNKWTLDHFRDKSTAKNFQTSTIDKIPGWKLPSDRNIVYASAIWR